MISRPRYPKESKHGINAGISYVPSQQPKLVHEVQGMLARTAVHGKRPKVKNQNIPHPHLAPNIEGQQLWPWITPARNKCLLHPYFNISTVKSGEATSSR